MIPELIGQPAWVLGLRCRHCKLRLSHHKKHCLVADWLHDRGLPSWPGVLHLPNEACDGRVYEVWLKEDELTGQLNLRTGCPTWHIKGAKPPHTPITLVFPTALERLASLAEKTDQE